MDPSYGMLHDENGHQGVEWTVALMRKILLGHYVT